MKRIFLSTFLLLPFNASALYGLDVISLSYELEETSLMKASFRADKQEMQKLIKAGEDVNAVAFCCQPSTGYPVLRYAIDSHSPEAVQILLAAGANPNSMTESEFPKRDVKIGNVRNLSLLSHAINIGAPIVIIEELIKNGANVDGTPKVWSDYSALMIAAYNGYTDAVRVLLHAGADASFVNSYDQKTALDYAQKQNHEEVIKMLKDMLQ
jgi:ankyrin repeat protein